MPTAVLCIGSETGLQTVQLLHLTLACSQVGQFHQIDAAVKGSNAQVDMVRERRLLEKQMATYVHHTKALFVRVVS
jgi:hypothetical protein